jgi:hypothetical protein
LQRVALGDDFEAVPLALGLSTSFLPRKPTLSAPVFIATFPVDAAFGHGLAWLALLPNLLLVAIERELGGERCRELRAIGELRESTKMSPTPPSMICASMLAIQVSL